MHGILTDDTLATYDNLVLERLWAKPNNYAVDAMHPAYGQAFRRFILFNDWFELLCDLNLGECALCYNRYLWARRFAKAYQTVHGPDAGIEQQVFRVLETAPADVDWTILESIDKGVGELAE